MSADTRGIRELAREFVNAKYPDGDFAQYTDPIEDLINDCAAFAESIVEQCCKDVCIGCADTELWGAAVFDDGYWLHRSTSPNAELPCDAAAIRSRWQRGEQNE